MILDTPIDTLRYRDYGQGFPIHVMNIVHGETKVHSAHRHDFHELIFAYEGSGSQVICDKVYPMIQGDFFFVHPKERHHYHSDEQLKIFNILIDSTSLKYPGMVEMFNLPGIAEYFAKYQSSNSHKITLAPKDELTVRNLCFRMRHEISHQDAGSSLSLKNCLAEIFLIISRATAIYGDQQPEKPMDSNPIHKALSIIHRDLTQNLTVAGLAEQVHLSPKYFGELFKEQCGISVQNTIHRRRVDMARNLLELGSKNMTEIALEVGYEDSNYFSRVFKKVCSMTPREYRKMCSFENE